MAGWKKLIHNHDKFITYTCVFFLFLWCCLEGAGGVGWGEVWRRGGEGRWVAKGWQLPLFCINLVDLWSLFVEAFIQLSDVGWFLSDSVVTFLVGSCLCKTGFAIAALAERELIGMVIYGCTDSLVAIFFNSLMFSFETWCLFLPKSGHWHHCRHPGSNPGVSCSISCKFNLLVQ